MAEIKKKNILIIVLCISLILMTNGCNSQTKNKPNNYKDTSSAVDNYFQNAKKDENIAAISYDDEKQVVVVTLIDNNKENQEKFLSNVNVDKKYIEFEQGGTYNTFDAKIVTLDSVKEDKISFNKYLTKENRTIYLENNIKELYIFDHQRRWTFKYYVTNTNQSLENSLKSVTDLLEKEANLKDGGTAIYKNKDKNITVIACNTLNGNKDVYIGDYQLSFKDNMCK